MPSIRMGTTSRVDAAPTMPHMLFPLWRLLRRTGPVGDRRLPRTRDGELTRGRVLRDHAAGADGGAFTHGDGRHQHAVAADARPIADHGAMFVGAVVIG